MEQEIIAQLKQYAETIENLNYYQVLRIDQTATHGQIRKAYHAQTRIFHPDRYFQLVDSDLKESIYKISKRVTEAYVCLRDTQKRRFYDQQLHKSQNQQVRYTEKSHQEQKKAKVEQVGKTEQGRKLYTQGLSQTKRKDFVGAERSFKMALAYEPDNELYKQQMEEAAKNIKTDYTIK